MTESVSSAASQFDDIVTVAALFDQVQRARDPELCAALAQKLDTFLVTVAKSRGAIDVAIGERLDALSIGDRAMDLGHCSVGDYAREKLGIAASTAEKMARLARALRERPLLRDAVRSGEVSTRQAEAVLPVARGEAEASWVAQARSETVRALKAAAKRACDDDEPYARLCIDLDPAKRHVVDEALEVAGQALGATAPKWQRLQTLCEEYLSSHAGRELRVAPPDDDFLEDARKWLEQESQRWSFLRQLEPVAVSEPAPDPHASARPIEADLLRLNELRARWDEVFGHLAMLFLSMQAWQLLEFASLDHYAEERLGMCGRAVEQRASLERSLERSCSLREALRERRVSYEQARLIARYADAAEVSAWIARSQNLTCVELGRALQADEEAKMCARGEFACVLPIRVRSLLRQAFEVWKPLLASRSTLQKQILARDGWVCQVPGCSRAAVHVHHIKYRSAGGTDDPENLISICAAHRLRGIHTGRIRVHGTAPHKLIWELGVS